MIGSVLRSTSSRTASDYSATNSAPDTPRHHQRNSALKTRTERLYHFSDRDEVDVCLAHIAAGDTSMVRELPLQPGQQDRRCVHLLGPVEPEASGTATPDRVGARRPARGPRGQGPRGVRSGRRLYAEYLCDELASLPFESWSLRRVVELADGSPMIEVGPGPGDVAAFLAAAGAHVTGIDLTPEMVDEARRR